MQSIVGQTRKGGSNFYMIFTQANCQEVDLFATFQNFVFTKRGEIRQETVTQLCLQAVGQFVIAKECFYPDLEVPKSQMWINTVVRTIVQDLGFWPDEK